MKAEFSPLGVGGHFWNPSFPAIEIKDPEPELSPYGHAKVVKIDNFPELEGRKGALLKWSDFEKKGYKLIVEIGKSKGYAEGVGVQILRLLRPTKDASYYVRVAKGNELWGHKELSPVTNKLLGLLNPAYRFKI